MKFLWIAFLVTLGYGQSTAASDTTVTTTTAAAAETTTVPVTSAKLTTDVPDRWGSNSFNCT